MSANVPNPPFPTVEDSGGSTLTDEISDVIEEHSRGLDADVISAAIEDVAAELEEGTSDRVSAGELKHALRKFLIDHGADLERDEALELLHGVADDLAGSSLAPDVDLLDSDPPRRLALRFDSAFALQIHLPRMLDDRGYFLESDLPLTHLDDIRVRVESELVDTDIELVGRVVRTAPCGFAIRIYPKDPDDDRRLHELPAEMRAARVGDQHSES